MSHPEHPPLIRPIRRGHWFLLDYLAAAAYTVLVLPLLLKYAGGAAALLAVPAGLLAFAVPVAIRRRWPLIALGLLAGGVLVTVLAEPRLYPLAIVPMAYLVYLAATRSARLAFMALAVSLASAGAAALPEFQHLGATIASGLGYLTVWTVGYAVGMHRRYTAELLRHQAELAEAELLRARRAVTDERLRIARELHDVIAHSISVITVQAAYGALICEEQPTLARTALDAIESTGRQSLTELRALLGVLRTADPDRASVSDGLEPSPSLADLDRLIAQTGQAGVQVQLTLSGHQRPLPAGLELTTYRIVQEALTNVVRHSGTATAQVLIEHSDAELVVEILNGGNGATAAADQPPGHGLIGMRERVATYGGTLHATPLPTGGFRVRACLPLPAAAPASRSFAAA